MLEVAKFSMGVGDRFGRQGEAQLDAFKRLEAAAGVVVAPVWNKSNREHSIIGTTPESVRLEADAAVANLGWQHPYYVDADHINLKNVDPFIASSDFFTLDVADFIGETLSEDEIFDFVADHEELVGDHTIPGLDAPLTLTRPQIAEYLRGSLFAVRQAGRIYRHIAEVKGTASFVTELSMDETTRAQSPGMLFVILAAAARERIPVQTIAPKFSGRFNKGVDYVGEVEAFAREFETAACVVRHAAERFGLPAGLKLSVHSGSDKFSLYPHIARVLAQHRVGLHLKTAGTTWLEEVVGLAKAGGAGLAVAKQIYEQALPRFDELCAPYATVVDINPRRLPNPDEVGGWSGGRFAAALSHNPDDSQFNSDFRQFIHVAFKIAAELGESYLDALEANREIVARQVTDNIYERHLRPIFGGLADMHL